MAVKEKALRRLADKLNAAGVTWAVGGEWLLNQKGLLPTYHVFDILVAESDIEKADKVLTRLGMRNAEESNAVFCVDYHFDGADIHVRAGVPSFVFDANCIGEDLTVLGATVHALSPIAGAALAKLDGKNTAEWDALSAQA